MGEDWKVKRTMIMIERTKYFVAALAHVQRMRLREICTPFLFGTGGALSDIFSESPL
jgi:hypothetical protein